VQTDQSTNHIATEHNLTTPTIPWLVYEGKPGSSPTDKQKISQVVDLMIHGLQLPKSHFEHIFIYSQCLIKYSAKWPVGKSF